jgi:TPR repeat protein
MKMARGVEKSDKEAVRFYQLAADQDHVKARFKICKFKADEGDAEGPKRPWFDV